MKQFKASEDIMARAKTISIKVTGEEAELFARVASYIGIGVPDMVRMLVKLKDDQLARCSFCLYMQKSKCTCADPEPYGQATAHRNAVKQELARHRLGSKERTNGVGKAGKVEPSPSKTRLSVV